MSDITSQTKEFCEEWRGLHGGNYYYILDGDYCIPIAKYATKTVRKRGDEVCYYVEESKITNKAIVRIFTSNSGSIYIEPDVEFINKCVDLPHLTHLERRFLKEWHEYYIPMLKFIKDTAVKGIRVSNMLEFHLQYLPKYPLSFFISYSSNARLKSFGVLTRGIHEIWIALRILKEFAKEIDFVLFQQSSTIPVANIGNNSLWYEFDFTPHTMCEGILFGKPLPQWLSQIWSRAQAVLGKSPRELEGLRPDIMFTQVVSSCSDLFKSSTIAIKLIIECKNFDYEFWAEDVEKQIIPYKKIFQPEHMVVASLKPVPQDVKKGLKSLGIEVIDHVHLGGVGEKQLVEYVKQVLVLV